MSGYDDQGRAGVAATSAVDAEDPCRRAQTSSRHRVLQAAAPSSNQTRRAGTHLVACTCTHTFAIGCVADACSISRWSAAAGKRVVVRLNVWRDVAGDPRYFITVTMPVSIAQSVKG